MYNYVSSIYNEGMGRGEAKLRKKGLGEDISKVGYVLGVVAALGCL